MTDLEHLMSTLADLVGIDSINPSLVNGGAGEASRPWSLAPAALAPTPPRNGSISNQYTSWPRFSPVPPGVGATLHDPPSDT